MLAGVCTLVGCSASLTEGKSTPGPGQLHGTWYLQQSFGLDDIPARRRGTQPYARFHPDGRFEGLDLYGDLEVGTYTVDTDDQTIKMTQGEESFRLRYAVVNDALLLGELPATDNADQPLIVLEWSRTPAGSPRQQALNDLLSRRPLPSQIVESTRKVERLLRLILDEYHATGEMPPLLGKLALDDALELQYLLLPWTEHTLPDEYDLFEPDRKALVLSSWTEYIYLWGNLFGDSEIFSATPSTIVLFEYPFYKDLPDIAVGFADGSVRRVPKDEVSDLLEEQTGHPLNEWFSILN
ncbi:MAG: hypothetical protein AAGC44_08245 [Planctomycetota bacterium]